MSAGGWFSAGIVLVVVGCVCAGSELEGSNVRAAGAFVSSLVAFAASDILAKLDKRKP